MVKKLFTGAPKAGERNCDAIWNADVTASFSHLVNDEENYGYQRAEQAGVEKELQYDQWWKPKRYRAEQFHVTATHHSEVEKQGKEQKSEDSCAKIISDLRPAKRTRSKPV